eukprot:2600531-Pyramimonas_sp.AAC.1
MGLAHLCRAWAAPVRRAVKDRTAGRGARGHKPRAPRHAAPGTHGHQNRRRRGSMREVPLGPDGLRAAVVARGLLGSAHAVAER